MHTKRVTFLGLLALLALPLICKAQSSAIDFAYGTGVVAPLRVIGGPYSAGTVSITVSQGYTVSATGITFNPLSTNAPVKLGSGSSIETLTPSSVSCTTPAVYGSCSFTVTTANTHGTGDIVQSGSLGLQEAVNYAVSQGGGDVVVNRAWARAGGTTAFITAAAPSPIVPVRDQRNGAVAPNAWWSMQPSTLTSLAAPATLAAGTVVFAATPVGTWAASAYYFCVTYVDALGGEGPCSATYNQTPTVNYSVTVTAPVASTGAVGWRFYAGASYDAAYLMPISSSTCTLTTLEVVMPACAIGSNGAWAAPPLTTTTLRPNGQSPTVNLLQPYPQGHTTFQYSPTAGMPVPFQAHYGPFPAFGSTTSGQVDILGSVNLPAGYLNYIGRTIKISGKISLGTTNTAALPTLAIGMAWVAGTTAGAPTAVCVFSGPATGSTVAYNMPFSCTWTTNAVGATAIGSIMPGGFASIQVPTGAAVGQSYTEQAVAAIGSLGLFAQDTIYVKYTSTTNTTAAPQLLDLHIETLQ